MGDIDRDAVSEDELVMRTLEEKEEEIALNEVDKYLMSIVRPYFEINESAVQSSPLDIPINSGLFTNFVDFTFFIKNLEKGVLVFR